MIGEFASLQPRFEGIRLWLEHALDGEIGGFVYRGEHVDGAVDFSPRPGAEAVHETQAALDDGALEIGEFLGCRRHGKGLSKSLEGEVIEMMVVRRQDVQEGTEQRAQPFMDAVFAPVCVARIPSCVRSTGSRCRTDHKMEVTL